ncbi:hypothetical protein THRCLA_06418 [Thraustotheca clavata]|uniref:Uncharacterized protein n=1 Tax=Thraustotheca clavata TaxID=74557 RepID=A0A1V9ZPH6_9STRA|nr:hypothetical protein THRCLA_06418 [Thraustotheca clavata]
MYAIRSYYVAFIPCPYALRAFIELLPEYSKTPAITSFQKLCELLPMAQLWPRLRASTLLQHNQYIELACTALQEIGMLELDVWPEYVLSWLEAHPVISFGCSANASMMFASMWHGHRINECALTLQSCDEIKDFARVAQWMGNAPNLKRLQIRHEAHIMHEDGLKLLFDAIKLSGIVELDVANYADDDFSYCMYDHLIEWLGTSHARRLSITALHVADRDKVNSLVTAIRSSQLESLEIAFMDDVTKVLFEEKIPKSLHTLSINLARIGTAESFSNSIANSSLAHLTIVNRTRQLAPTYDKTMSRVISALAALPYLQTLDITYINMNNRALTALQETIPKLQSLESLSLTCFGSKPHYLPGWLTLLLPTCPKLHRLGLRNVYWSANDVNLWNDINWPTLKLLCVRGSKVESETLHMAAPSVHLCCNDDMDHLKCCFTEPEKVSHTIEAVEKQSYLCL